MRLFGLEISNKLIGFGYVLLGVIALSSALVAEYEFGLQPCFLCLAQRLPYIFIIVWGIAAFIRNHEYKDFAIYTGLIAFALLCGGIVGLYQVGGEQHWWQLSSGCSVAGLAEALKSGNFEQFIETKASVPCDVVSWSFMGLSFAALNAIFSFIAALISIYIARMAWLKPIK